MLGFLGNKIQGKLDDLGRKTKLDESDIKSAIRDIKMILVESDVNYKVAKEFCKNIEEKSLGEEILKGLNPSEQIFKIVKDELHKLLSGDNELNFKENNYILMVGLQGAGKTTTTAKIAHFLRKKKEKNNPLLVACDVYRPAAIDQLKTLGKQLNIDVYSEEDTKDVISIAKNALEFATSNGNDLVIFDTAGRTHIDTELMGEIELLQKTINSAETLLVVDGTVGQVAVEVAEEFSKYVDITGLVFTKMDGDSRGGGLLSVKSVTGKDIKLLGMSEKMDGLEFFNPERVVNRILGEGDLLGLIEKAEEFADEQETEDMMNKMTAGKFDFNDFLKQMKTMKKMGGITSIMGMIPGMKKIDTSMINDDELKKVEAIIESMTQKERSNPNILNSSRKRRIAQGSGRAPSEVNKLIKRFEQSKKMMKQMGNMKDMDPEKIMNMIGGKK